MENRQDAAQPKPDIIGSAIEALRSHPFVQHLDNLRDIPAGEYQINFSPKSGFPTMTHRFNVEPETLAACEQIADAYHRSMNILRNLDNLQRVRMKLVKIYFDDDLDTAIEELQFQAENYFLRLPPVLEQLYDVISTLYGIEMSRGPSSLRQFERALRIRNEALWILISAYKESSYSFKQIRNLVAHLGEFVEDSLDQMAPLIQVAFSPDTVVKLRGNLGTYRDSLAATCERQILDAIELVTGVFGFLLVATQERYEQLTTADGHLILAARLEAGP